MNSTATNRFHHLSGVILLCMVTVLSMMPVSGLAPLCAAESTESGGEVDPIEETDVVTVTARRRRVLPLNGQAERVLAGASKCRALPGWRESADDRARHRRVVGLYPLRQ